MLNFIKRHLLASALVLVNVIAIVIVTVAVFFDSARTATIDIQVAPSEAVIELNGKAYENFETHDVLPGDYHVKISMDGMQTKEYDVRLADDGFLQLWDYLLDENGGFDYYIINPEEEIVLSNIAKDEQSKAFVEEYDNIHSISDVLPLEYYDRSDPNNPIGVFVEESESECAEIICLVAYGGEENREIVNNLIVEAGFNPDDYNVQFAGGE